MMRSGGNCAPIDRQRSWSHSWMCESAGRGGGGAGEQRGRRRDEFLLDSSTKKTHTRTLHTTVPHWSLDLFYGCTCFPLYIDTHAHCLVPCAPGRCAGVRQLIGKE